MRHSFRLAISIVVGLVASAAIAIAYLAALADSFLWRGLDIVCIADNLFLFKIAIPPEKPYVRPSPAHTVSTPGFLSRTGSASKKALRLGDSDTARSTATDRHSAASLR
jgi:hypothetical protein